MELVNQWLAQIGVAPLVGAAIIAAATVVAAGLVRLLGDRVALALSKWSRLGIRGQLFKIIRLPLWTSVLLTGVLLEVQWLTPRPPLGLFIAGAAKTTLAIIWLIVLGRTLTLVSSRLGGYYPDAKEFLRLSENVGIAIIVLMAGLVILSIWQINLTPLLASAGLIGIVVGLAAKDTLGNFFGGISVFLDRPFRPGDYLVLNSGERGKVIDIGIRSTKILTRDDVLISVPNSLIVSM
ncbi:MAG: mechanosensitive ion channel domain-containing protein [Desulfomonilaceae bacterium]